MLDNLFLITLIDNGRQVKFNKVSLEFIPPTLCYSTPNVFPFEDGVNPFRPRCDYTLTFISNMISKNYFSIKRKEEELSFENGHPYPPLFEKLNQTPKDDAETIRRLFLEVVEDSKISNRTLYFASESSSEKIWRLLKPLSFFVKKLYYDSCVNLYGEKRNYRMLEECAVTRISMNEALSILEQNVETQKSVVKSLKKRCFEILNFSNALATVTCVYSTLTVISSLALYSFAAFNYGGFRYLVNDAFRTT